MFQYRHLTLVVLPTLLLAACLEANAQQAQNSLPGSILQDTQQKFIPNPSQPDVQKVKPPESEVEDTRKPPPPDQEVDSAPIKKVFLQEIIIEDATILTEKEISDIVSEYENKDNTFADIQTLTDRLTALYRDKGYVTSRVYIPPQKLKGGKLTLKALEGTMGELDIKEGRFFKARSVKHAISLDKGEHFNIDALKKDLRTINENPDRNVRAILKPGEKTGETDLQLEIADRRPIHFTPTWDNMGRRLIGDNRLGGRLVHNNLLGFGDMMMTSASFTRRTQGIVNHYQVPIGSRGTVVGFDYAMSRLELGEEFKILDVEGRAQTYSPFISQTLINGEKQRVSVDVAFDFKQMRTDILDSKFSRDQLRVLRSGLNWEQYDDHGRTFSRHELALGLDILGGTTGDNVLASRTGAGTQFFRYTGSIIRTQRLPWQTYGIFRAIGQLSPSRLVSAEQFQAGGALSVRGYREGHIIGDSGLLVSGEWRIPFFFVDNDVMVPRTNMPLRQAVQFASFVDFGTSHINRAPVGTRQNEYLLSTGVGLRVQLPRNMTARVDLGFPLINHGHTARLHFGLSGDLF